MKGNREASPLQGEFPVVLGLNLKEAKLPPHSVPTPESRRASAREMGSLGNSVAESFTLGV